MPEIVLVRHAESEANLAGTWQGRGNAELSLEGRRQVDALAARMAGRSFDAIVSSPLDRARETAVAFGDDARVDDRLAEVDLGEWEGVSYELVSSRDMALLRSIYTGGDDRFGASGERMSEVAARAWSAIDDLAGRLGVDGTGVVVTHGGVIDSLIGSLLPLKGRRAHRMVENSSLTHLVGGPGRWRIARLNDSTHLERLTSFTRTHLESGGGVLALIRHGRTQANLERRIQGQSCWGLDEVGKEQAALLGDWYGPLERVYTSPLSRAVATASFIASGEPVAVDGLMEIGMGHWEGLGWEEIAEGWPDLVRRIYQDGEDLARGEIGETWEAMTARIAATLSSLDVLAGQVTGVVSHGGAIRAYLQSLWDGVGELALYRPENTSVTHIALTGDGPIVCDYAVAPHLEQTEQ